jgi:hypothetical protein
MDEGKMQMPTYIVGITRTKTGRQNGYTVEHIESGEVVKTFRNKDHATWRYALNAATAERDRLNYQAEREAK